MPIIPNEICPCRPDLPTDSPAIAFLTERVDLMKRIFLLLSVCATLGTAGCCCCHGHNDCIDDCQGGYVQQGYDCPPDCDGHRHRHCKLFHHKKSRDCQKDGPCQDEDQIQTVDGYPVEGRYSAEGRCQADGRCKTKGRRGKHRKSCPHCGREFAGVVPGGVSPCCGESLIGDDCNGILQAGYAPGMCGDCCGNGLSAGCDCLNGNCGVPGGCATGNCNTGIPGAPGGCATGNCGTTAPTPAPGTSAMSHPYDELQALQAAGWSIVPTPGSSTTGSAAPNGMEPVPAPPSAPATFVPVKPAGAR